MPFIVHFGRSETLSLNVLVSVFEIFLFLDVWRSVMPSENRFYKCEHPLKFDTLTRRSSGLLAFLFHLGRMSLKAEGTPPSCFPNCDGSLKKLPLVFGHGADKLRGSYSICSVTPPCALSPPCQLGHAHCSACRMPRFPDSPALWIRT